MKKILAISLIFALMLAFAACADKDVKVPETSSPSAAATKAAETAETTKFASVSGKTVLLKSVSSESYAVIKTDADNVATYLMLHKIFADDASYKAALEKGSYDSFNLIASTDNSREVIYRNTETIKGMTYDEIIKAAEARTDYIVVPSAE